MKKTLCIVLAIVLLSAFLGGCIYDIAPGEELILAAIPYNVETVSGPEDLDFCAEQGFFLVAFTPYYEVDGIYYRWYRDGQPLGGRSDEWWCPDIEDGPGCAVFYPPLPAGLDPDDPVLPGPLFTPGTYAIELFEGLETNEVLLRLSVVVPSCSPGARRADVSVTIYGGWDGIPVQAWVGGTEQETLYTARDASGEAAVLWTFYPPAGGWNVSVAPQTPPGKDPERWQYKLLRIEGPTPGVADNEPASADVSVIPGGQYRLFFQLLDMGPGAGE